MSIKKSLVRALGAVSFDNTPLSTICTKHDLRLEDLVTTPPPNIDAALCLPCFRVAKLLGRQPQEVSEHIASTVQLPPEFERVYVEKAFVNFTLSDSYLSDIVGKAIQGSAFSNLPGRNEKIVIEHTSVNPGKPWHIGHARNAVLGDVFSRIARAAGYAVEVQNYIDDLGRQVATVFWGINNLKELPSRVDAPKVDLWQGLVYAKAAQLAKKEKEAAGDPEEGMPPKPENLPLIAAQTNNGRHDIEAQLLDIMHHMEAGDNQIAIDAKRYADESVRAQLQTAFRMGIHYDLMIWETDIIRANLFTETLRKLLATDKVRKLESGEDAGCVVIDMSQAGPEFRDQKKPYKILVRSSGTAVYTGKDIAFQMWKFGLTDANFKYEEFLMQPNGQPLWTTTTAPGEGAPSSRFAHANRVINVIGHEQEFPQKVVYESLRVLGHEQQSQNSHHLSYEWVYLPEGRFSGRTGNWVGSHLDAVLDYVAEAALTELRQREVDMPEQELKTTAEKIAVGAVRFFMIRSGSNKKLTFDLKQMLSFEGDSAPYCVYSYVRTANILRKAGATDVTHKPDMFELKPYDKKTAKLPEPEYERILATTIARLPEVIDTAVQAYDVSLIPKYTLDLCKALNGFYENCRVIGAETPEKGQTRLELVKAANVVLEKCLDLMGVPKLERM